MLRSRSACASRGLVICRLIRSTPPRSCDTDRTFCATVAGSTLVADLAPLEVRTDVQGASDMTMQLTAAAAGAVAGVVVGTWGYAALNAFAGVLACGVVVAGVVSGRPAGHRVGV